MDKYVKDDKAKNNNAESIKPDIDNRSSNIPASEAWLFANPKALASVKRGLRGAKRGKLSKLDSDTL